MAVRTKNAAAMRRFSLHGCNRRSAVAGEQLAPDQHAPDLVGTGADPVGYSLM